MRRGPGKRLQGSSNKRSGGWRLALRSANLSFEPDSEPGSRIAGLALASPWPRVIWRLGAAGWQATPAHGPRPWNLKLKRGLGHARARAGPAGGPRSHGRLRVSLSPTSRQRAGGGPPAGPTRVFSLPKGSFLRACLVLVRGCPFTECTSPGINNYTGLVLHTAAPTATSISL